MELRRILVLFAVVVVTVAAVGLLIDLVISPGPRIIVRGIRKPSPPPPPPLTTFQWWLEAPEGRVTCESTRTVCTVDGSGSLHRRWVPWARLTAAGFELADGSTITMTALGSTVRIDSPIPLEVSGNTLVAPAAARRVSIDWKFWFDTNLLSDAPLEFDYRFY